MKDTLLTIRVLLLIIILCIFAFADTEQYLIVIGLLWTLVFIDGLIINYKTK